LVDESGPLDAPITGNERVRVRPETECAWLVADMPEGVVSQDQAGAALEGLAARSGVGALRFRPI